MATHSQYFLPGESPWSEEPGRLRSIGHKEWDTTEATLHTRTIPKFNRRVLKRAEQVVS